MAQLYLHEAPAYSSFKVQPSDVVSWKAPVIGPAVFQNAKILRAQDNFYSAKSNRVIRINLPREDMCMEKAWLSVSLQLAATLPGTPGDYLRLANFSTSFLEEVRIRIGGFEHSVRNYNILAAFFQDIEIPKEVKQQQLYDNFAWGPDHVRNVWAGSRQKIVIPLKWVMMDKGILPLDAIYQLSGPVDQYIELVIAEPTTCIETNGSNPDILIDQVELHYDQITSSGDAFRNKMKGDILSNSGFFSFPTVRLYQTPIVASVTDCNIPHKENNLHSITTVLTDLSKRNDMAVSSKFENYPKDFGGGCVVRSSQTDVGGHLFPMERNDASDQAQAHYQDYLQSFGFSSNTMKDIKFPSPISLAQFNGVAGLGKFFMHLDLHTSPTDLSKGVDNEMVVNPLNLRNETRSIIFKLDITNSPPDGTNLVAYHFIRYSQLARIDPSSGHIMKYML